MTRNMISLAIKKIDENSRVGRIRKRFMEAKEVLSIERAQLYTEAFRKHWGKRPVTRASFGIENVLSNMSVVIRDDELIVGCRTERIKGIPLFPEIKSKWLERDAERLNERPVQRIAVSEENKKILINAILPFWEDKSVESVLKYRMPSEVSAEADKFVYSYSREITYGIGHFIPDYEKLLSIGLKGLIDEARNKYNSLLLHAKSGEKGMFFDSVIRSMESVIKLAARYSEKAAEMSFRTENVDRQTELKELSRMLTQIPENPPKTFYEALQFVYIIHLTATIESGGTGISLGRLDQYLYPFYKQDISAKVITPDKVRELLSLFFLKLSEIINMLEEPMIPLSEGFHGRNLQNITIGGVKPDGEDGTNELTYILLRAYADINLPQPSVSIRISKKTPQSFLKRSVEYARQSIPLFFINDDVAVTSLINMGIDPFDARNYAIAGGVELTIPGKCLNVSNAIQFNVLKCLEYALNDGLDNIFMRLSGVKTGNPRAFKSVIDVWEAYKKQVSAFLGQVIKAVNTIDQALGDIAPAPFTSSVMEGPLQKGVGVLKGGAVYNATGISVLGIPHVADSLVVLKKYIFEQKKATMDELMGWLSEDWADAEDKRLEMMNLVPKFGQGADEADNMTDMVINHFCDIVKRFLTYRDGAFWAGAASMGMQVAMGAFTGPTPDGRLSGDPIVTALSPQAAGTIKGPYNIITSLSKMPLSRLPNGAFLSIRFSAEKTQKESVLKWFETFFDKGGFQVEFNMCENECLLRAIDDPENHKDLIVRFGGYPERFYDLSDIAKESILIQPELDPDFVWIEKSEEQNETKESDEGPDKNKDDETNND